MLSNGAGTSEHGGFYDKGESFGGPAFDLKKVWWTQAEGLNALLLMHRKFAASTDRYWKAFLKQWDFIEKHVIDPVHGGWYCRDDPRRPLNRRRCQGQPVEGQLSHSRALMNVSKMLENESGEKRP